MPILFAPFIGNWEDPDGATRQELTWGLDQRIVRTRTLFRDGEEWKLVSEGTFYTDPTSDEVVGFAVAIDMPFRHTDMTVLPADGGIDLEHTAYDDAGHPTETAERWRTAGGDEYTWELFERKGSELTPWMGGEWHRVDG